MKKSVVAILLLGGLVLAAGHTHLIMPASSDECQQDISHKGHIAELPMFHCIAHKEFVPIQGAKGTARVGQWFHLHPWMTMDWHLENGFSPEHAAELIAQHDGAPDTLTDAE